jgi:hypothetical protein
MKSEYQIALHSKTPTGFETYAEFHIGTDEAAANRLFRSLKGSPDNIGDGILLMELRAICRGLPIDIRMIRCTLDEVTENCRIITKHCFNSFNVRRSLME